MADQDTIKGVNLEAELPAIVRATIDDLTKRLESNLRNIDDGLQFMNAIHCPTS